MTPDEIITKLVADAYTLIVEYSAYIEDDKAELAEHERILRKAMADNTAAIREAVAAEREACAKIADDAREDEEYGHAAFRCVQIAQAIRARTKD